MHDKRLRESAFDGSRSSSQRRGSFGRPLVLLGCFFVLVFGGALTGRAQCPTIDNIGWPQGSTVRFFLDGNLTDEQKRQARLAITEWNRANVNNNSRVRFEEDVSGQNFQFRFLNGSLDGHIPAFANRRFNSSGVVSATLTYDPNATFTNTNILIADPSQPGYDTVLIKLTLHEMGHTMGLDHPFIPADNCEQPDGATVMNYICGVNDQGGNMPTFVTACDQNGINSESIYPAAIDDPQFFVTQQYRDFLNREPDSAGLAFWTNEITSCGSDAQCREVKRINVSAAFFLSIEFQNTGYLVYRFYKASFGRRPAFGEFIPDTQSISQGVVVNSPGWEQQLEANKRAFADSWVNRTDFSARYGGVSNEQYVDTLFANAGVAPSQAERDELVNGLNSGTQTRATVIRRVAENQTFYQIEFNPAFVLMQYFGYLRRDPDEAGYNFWLAKLNKFNGNFVQAEMVKAFITSSEYRGRFGQP